MNPRDAALLQASAILLAQSRDTAYGPAHAVRDALLLEKEVTQQSEARRNSPNENERAMEYLRQVGAL